MRCIYKIFINNLRSTPSKKKLRYTTAAVDTGSLCCNSVHLCFCLQLRATKFSYIYEGFTGLQKIHESTATRGLSFQMQLWNFYFSVFHQVAPKATNIIRTIWPAQLTVDISPLFI